MRSQKVRRSALVVVIGLAAAFAAGCGSKEPKPNAKGYYEGPMDSKASSGKSPGGMPPGGNPPATPPSR